VTQTLTPEHVAAINALGRRLRLLETNAETWTKGMWVGWHGDAATIPSGWVLCDGALLPGGIGNAPDFRGRVPIQLKAGDAAFDALGETGGTATANLAHDHTPDPHTHTGPLHTHPGSHSHGMDPHRHQMGHDHLVNNAPTSTSTRADGANAVGSATHGHGTTSNSNNTVTGDGERTSDATAFTTTQADSNAPAASFSGNTGPVVSAGNTGSALSTTSLLPPYIVTQFIYRWI
jgi:hypothetical protein